MQSDTLSNGCMEKAVLEIEVLLGMVCVAREPTKVFVLLITNTDLLIFVILQLATLPASHCVYIYLLISHFDTI